MAEPTEKPFASAVMVSMDTGAVALFAVELLVDSLQPAIKRLAAKNTLRKNFDVITEN